VETPRRWITGLAEGLVASSQSFSAMRSQSWRGSECGRIIFLKFFQIYTLKV
jgi:hypothetical protein